LASYSASHSAAQAALGLVGPAAVAQQHPQVVQGHCEAIAETNVAGVGIVQRLAQRGGAAQAALGLVGPAAVAQQRPQVVQGPSEAIAETNVAGVGLIESL
jgi:hypothetical protein